VAVDSLVAQPMPDTASGNTALAPPSPSPKNPVNPNTADPSTLESLPGIGPALSERIVQHRSSRSFRSVDELQEVSGIGPKTLADLRPLVQITPPDTTE